ncbi:hypothetical protein HMPREF9714_01753 [Myroides odoratimimus CCUG 12901]|nr:hypothetical protein MYRA21_2826 [Myroides sp. A21]EHO10068.1 hypothetical protein HMPREF9714_01753 [Myroides odoratimimus CCUG 12901]
MLKKTFITKINSFSKDFTKGIYFCYNHWYYLRNAFLTAGAILVPNSSMFFICVK